ncbi:MAG: hypothetical protein CME30_03065 [Gemmatimonadetes bacterium]|nr:hypothetical protein [Gemmatimonadota bacterium]
MIKLTGSKQLWVSIFLSVMVNVQFSTVSAQRYNPSLERQLIREAASYEGRGDLKEAERVLRLVLSANPTSDIGLLAIDRVLREQGVLEKILPLVNDYLEVDEDSPVAREVGLKVYRDLNELETLKESAEDWLAIAEFRAEPYRKVSEVFLGAYGRREALEVLRRGEQALDGTSQFSLEIGDLLIELDEHDSAAIAWAKGIGADGSQTSAVMRRVTALGDEEQVLVGILLDELAQKPTTTARLRAATRIALEAGLLEETLELASTALQGLEGQARRGFLTVLARETEEVRRGDKVALWAYESIREQASDLTEIKALNYRIVTAALGMGDTLKALEAQYAIADALPRENSERRRALADGLRMGVIRNTEEQIAALEHFKDEFPQAREIDELSVLIALGLDPLDDEVLAKSLLDGVDGPRSDLERGYLHLANNEIDLGKESFKAAVPGLPPHQATEVLTLLDLLERLQASSLEDVARAAVFEHRGDWEGSLILLALRLIEAPNQDKPILLAFSAGIAQEAGKPDQAAKFRQEIVQSYPESMEVPRATLELARFKGMSDDSRQEAIKLLEDLIVENPDSMIAPLARRELQRLAGG